MALGMTRHDMLQAMPATDLDLYRAMQEIEPFGQDRDDWRVAVQTAAIAAMVGVKKSTGGSFTAADFLLTFDRAKQPATKLPDLAMVLDPEDATRKKADGMQAALLKWARAHNAQFGLDEYGKPLEPQTDEPEAEPSQPADATENK